MCIDPPGPESGSELEPGGEPEPGPESQDLRPFDSRSQNFAATTFAYDARDRPAEIRPPVQGACDTILRLEPPPRPTSQWERKSLPERCNGQAP
jgi:hypothetical protein